MNGHRMIELPESPASGTGARGIGANEKVLKRFLESFPDHDELFRGAA